MTKNKNDLPLKWLFWLTTHFRFSIHEYENLPENAQFDHNVFVLLFCFCCVIKKKELIRECCSNIETYRNIVSFVDDHDILWTDNLYDTVWTKWTFLIIKNIIDNLTKTSNWNALSIFYLCLLRLISLVSYNSNYDYYYYGSRLASIQGKKGLILV